jgi:integrase
MPPRGAALPEDRPDVSSGDDLRHTAASLAISAGANVKVVQQMLGHARASMTLDTYAGLFQADVDKVAESVSKLCPRWA